MPRVRKAFPAHVFCAFQQWRRSQIRMRGCMCVCWVGCPMSEGYGNIQWARPRVEVTRTEKGSQRYWMSQATLRIQSTDYLLNGNDCFKGHWNTIRYKECSLGNKGHWNTIRDKECSLGNKGHWNTIRYKECSLANYIFFRKFRLW